MKRALLESRFAPWAGLVAGAFGWGLHQQVLSDMLHYDCHLGGTAAGLIALVLVGALIIAGALWSLAARRAGLLPARQFLATLSVMAAAIFFFAVLLQTLATAVLPGCGA